MSRSLNRPVESPLPTLAAVVGVEPAAPSLAPPPAAETFAGSETFVGFSPRTGRRHMFGGQLVGQALAAASRTVDVPFHSLHSYFLYGGDTTTPVEYEVHRTRDSRSFATRRVVGYQHGRPILEVSASFTAARGGFEHADPAPLDVPAPETVTPLVDHMSGWGVHDARASTPFGVLDFRPVSVVSPLAPETHPPTQHVWFRAAEQLPDDPAVQACALAYATDLYMLATSLRPHGVASADPKIFFVSLDHSLWLHRDVRVDDWLLHEQHSSSSSGGRAITFGKVFTRDGVLVASTAQEGVVRRPSTP